MKLLTKHTLYEIYNEFKTYSVFVDHKPTKEEVEEICKKEEWVDAFDGDSDKVEIKKIKYIYTK